MILGEQSRIANGLWISEAKDCIDLEFYPHGTPRQYIRQRQVLKPAAMRKWVTKMIESIVLILHNRVIHSDLRLEQWLVDQNWDVRPSDFNRSGYSNDNKLGLTGSEARYLECAAHCMPRGSSEHSMEQSDLFALASSLYELKNEEKPNDGSMDGDVERLYAAGALPDAGWCTFGRIIPGC